MKSAAAGPAASAARHQSRNEEISHGLLKWGVERRERVTTILNRQRNTMVEPRDGAVLLTIGDDPDSIMRGHTERLNAAEAEHLGRLLIDAAAACAAIAAVRKGLRKARVPRRILQGSPRRRAQGRMPDQPADTLAKFLGRSR
jgi:hypothetical protein